jgi:4-hydroxybenzoate polyprenyltransferase
MIKSYLSFIKFSHTIFALPFAVIGFFLGVKHTSQIPDWLLFLKIILCMVFARTAAMAYNRYADRKIDSINDRTREREIPSGKISSAAAITLVIISSLLFITTTYFINTICFYLSPVALAVVLGYSLTKRFTWLCHFILGLGLSLAPIGAYLAVTGKFDLLPLHFSAAVLAWVSGFDIIYALQDEKFDQTQHLYSVPAKVGSEKALNIARLLHLFSAGILIDAGMDAHFGIFYWLGVLAFSILLIYQHTLVRHDDLSKVNLAFFTTNGIASLVFACFVVAELLK